ncbi:hypothetical protein PR202_gb23348 [Eleusine coracana subsp. coracana]|uniref:Uncharacterized protein n=1 Tax=Eleusine coracana subsp. coracana TaxID=191504 RepID=A0AAV5FJY4_ELECO|nr:hypothetical protein QOZ80_6BG0479250 [Eleusine coracana subsp. coracana]GJN34665.1 hypothetical protein PR202_gb23348 [Eleusine coracana subsp. coracana]
MAAGLLLGDATALGGHGHRAASRRPPLRCLRSWALRPPLGATASLSRNRRRGHVARFAASASGGGDGGEDSGDLSEDESQRAWEAELSRRLKEAEEMEELERTAEQLQSQATEESEEEKRERVRRELEKVAKEQAERRETAKQMFDLGQKAYGRGMYGRSIEFLEAALTIIRPSSLLGGEIQIWLAMAYEANRRHKDCIALYKELENNHPMISIRRQAAELRYISEAPKLKISNDEVVSIPQIGSSWDWYAGTWSDKTKEQEEKKRMMSTASNQLQPPPNVFGDFSFLRRPSEWTKNAWVIVTLWVLLIGTAIYLQR